MLALRTLQTFVAGWRSLILTVMHADAQAEAAIFSFETYAVACILSSNKLIYTWDNYGE